LYGGAVALHPVNFEVTMNRSSWLHGVAVLFFMLLLTACARQDSTPLRVGVVHALTGTMAANEAPLVEAVRMAVDELNANGGVLGRKVEVVVADSASIPLQAAKEADRLIKQEKIDVLFACWTSSCRKAVKPVVESNHHLMFYPVQYEGLEQSPNIIYTGATANQQIIPGTHWALKNLGKRVFLAGSDYVFPRIANRIIHDVVLVEGGEVVGEAYRPIGNKDFSALVESIRFARPDVILNTVNGDSNVAFFRALQQAGLNHLPLLSFSVDANNLVALSEFRHDQHYTAWSYFQELPGEANQRFVRDWRRRLKTPMPTSDAIHATYSGVKLWAQAVNAAGNANLDVVNLSVASQSVAAPSGVMAVDARTRHVWMPMRIGKVVQGKAGGGFELLFDFGQTLRPEPFPLYRTREAWDVIAQSEEIRLPKVQP
jgi:urea transport system substrate-binding protein